jgi:predicted NodU family carbamoyl transferase
MGWFHLRWENAILVWRYCPRAAQRILKCEIAVLQAGKIVGIFGGTGEIGRRALGNRSILADPRQLK